MVTTCYRRADCRLCGGIDLELVLSLTPTPPANAFVDGTRLGQLQQEFPLDLFLCMGCGHVQLLDVVDPTVLFEDYIYVSGTSPVSVQHFEDYAARVINRFDLAADDFIVDIGSNDGTLLAAFKARGMSVVGVDPARNIASRATQTGIETVAAFFTPELSRKLVRERGRANVVVANNVFAHADDLAAIAEGVRPLLHPEGVFVFEVSYLVDVYEKTLFDTIYHEHLSYHSVAPLLQFFSNHGLKLFSVEQVDSHGGSLRGFVGHADGPHNDGRTIKTLIARERMLRLDKMSTLKTFGGKIDKLGHALADLLGRFRGEGQSIAGFGAPAKAATLMYHFDIGPNVIDFIVDESAFKQGLYSPGMHIPILPSQALYERQPDAVVILAWNFAKSIIDKHQKYLDCGGRFIIPLPTPEVVE